ncbi:MAG: pilus assembly protein [Micrococcales bacterium]|nr:pilus assembly protein [Micrococcales bacterium]
MTPTTNPTRDRGDTGTLSLSTAITVPAIIVFLALTIMAGRLAAANGAVESAANEAARAASISRTHADADAAARATAATVLANAGCTTIDVSPDLTGLSAPLGEFAQVSVTVTCTVPLAGLVVLNQADRTITHTATSVVDPYRSR